MAEMFKHRFFHFICLILFSFVLDYVRGDRCYYRETTQVRRYTSCGFLWMSRCAKYSSQIVTKSKCCHPWLGPNCDQVLCGTPSISNGRADLNVTSDEIQASYSCDQHYKLTSGDSIRYCQEDGFWDGQQPHCAYMDSCSSSPCSNDGICFNEPDGFQCACPMAWSGTTCEINIVDCGYPGNIEHGSVAVTSMKYGSKAVFTCNEHYNMTNGDSEATCQMNFAWDGTRPTCTFVNSCGSNLCQNSATCVNGLNLYTCICGPGWSGVNCEQDVQPPVLEKCPEVIQKNATKRTLVVSWPEPVFTDPFNNGIDVTANYREAEFEFPWGDFTVQYVATKVNNGLFVECTFNISVRPTPCQELNIPRNGARICNGWKRDYGVVCLLACKQNFTILSNYSYDKLYVCAASGTWIFSGPMPDCLVSVDSDEERLIYHPQSVSPAVTSCDDQTIRQHYIDVLTQSGELAAYCHKYPVECRPENVDVTCDE